MSSPSEPRYTSRAEGFRTAEEIEALRPIPAPKARPRKAGQPVLREVTNGIVCFCGERFSEAQSLEFMLHLRAEVGKDLAILNRSRAHRNAAQRERLISNPEWRERRNAKRRLKRANDHEWREAQNAAIREKRAKDPEWAERRRAQEREWSRTRRERRDA